MASADDESGQHPDEWHQHREHEQQSTGRRHVVNWHRMQHLNARSSASALVGASSVSVTVPVAWNNRSSSATARAVAENATTMPVISKPCGTGSPAKPAAAPRRAIAPNNRNTPLPITLKARSLRSGCGFV